MADPTGEAEKKALRLDFNRRLMLQFRDSTVTSDAGLLAYRELDDASLAVRQSLAKAHGDEALSRAKGGSPFSSLLDVAREQPSGATGLERLWLPESGLPVSVSFNWRFSLRSPRKEQLVRELLFSRL